MVSDFNTCAPVQDPEILDLESFTIFIKKREKYFRKTHHLPDVLKESDDRINKMFLAMQFVAKGEGVTVDDFAIKDHNDRVIL